MRFKGHRAHWTPTLRKQYEKLDREMKAQADALEIASAESEAASKTEINQGEMTPATRAKVMKSNSIGLRGLELGLQAIALNRQIYPTYPHFAEEEAELREEIEDHKNHAEQFAHASLFIIEDQ